MYSIYKYIYFFLEKFYKNIYINNDHRKSQ